MTIDDELHAALSTLAAVHDPDATDRAWALVCAEADARRHARRRGRLLLAAACLAVAAVVAGTLVVTADDEARLSTDEVDQPAVGVDPAAARALAQATVSLSGSLADEWLTTTAIGAGVGDAGQLEDRRAATDAALADWEAASTALATAGVALDDDVPVDEALAVARSSTDGGTAPAEVGASYAAVVDRPARALVATARASDDPRLAAELLVVDGLAGRLSGRAAVAAALLVPGPDQPARAAAAVAASDLAQEVFDAYAGPAQKQRWRDALAGSGADMVLMPALDDVALGLAPTDPSTIVAATAAGLAGERQVADAVAAEVGRSPEAPPEGEAAAAELVRHTLDVQRLVDEERAAALADLGAQAGAAPPGGATGPFPNPELSAAVDAWRQAADAFVASSDDDRDALARAGARIEGLATLRQVVTDGRLGPTTEPSVADVARMYDAIDQDLSQVVLAAATHLDGAAVVDAGLVALLPHERAVAAELALLAIDEAGAVRQGTGAAHARAGRAALLVARFGTPDQRAARERFDAGPPSTDEVVAILTTGEARRQAEARGGARGDAGDLVDPATLWQWSSQRRAALAELSTALASTLDAR